MHVNEHELLLHRLLLGSATSVRALHTRAEWAEALQLLQHDAQADTLQSVNEQQTTTCTSTRRFLDAVDAIVPHLPEWNNTPRVQALLDYCRHAYPVEFDQLLRAWIQSARFSTRNKQSLPSAHFRIWLLQWLDASGICTTTCTSDSDAHDVNETLAHLWRHTLHAALLVEEHPTLRYQLTRLLHAIPPTNIDIANVANDALQPPVDSIEALLDAYIAHAQALAPFALLCAAKLSSYNSNAVAPTDSVAMRMRWGALLAPALFEPLVRHCIAWQVFPLDSSSDASFTLHPFIRRLVHEPEWITDRTVQHQRLEAIATQLRRACAANAAHVAMSHTAQSSRPCATTTTTSSSSNATTSSFLSLSAAAQRVVLLELERDLEASSCALMPHVVVAFHSVVRALLISATHAPDATNDVLHAALQSLCALVGLRRACSCCCFRIASLLVALRVARHCVWQQRGASLLLAVVTQLNEQLAIAQTEQQQRWILQFVLQTLLFECDVRAVTQCLAAAVGASLPPRIVRLAQLRVA